MSSIPSTYVESSPKYLINLLESGKIHAGKKVLNKLLTSREMHGVWNFLTKKIKNEKEWDRVFQDICSAKHKSNKIRRYVSGKEVSESYIKISKDLDRLSKKIENTELDVLTYEFLNNEALVNYGLDNIQEFDSQTRCEMAYKVIPYWPPVSELLEDMSEKIKKTAEQTLTLSRSSDRDNDRLKEREFVFWLGQYFKKMFNQSMYSTIASITSAIFDDPDFRIDKNFVISVLKKRGGKT